MFQLLLRLNISTKLSRLTCKINCTVMKYGTKYIITFITFNFNIMLLLMSKCNIQFTVCHSLEFKVIHFSIYHIHFSYFQVRSLANSPFNGNAIFNYFDPTD